MIFCSQPITRLNPATLRSWRSTRQRRGIPSQNPQGDPKRFPVGKAAESQSSASPAPLANEENAVNPHARVLSQFEPAGIVFF
jgi:hypothetical protein